MKIIGFNFNKINVEKLKEPVEGMKINTNISIPELKEIKQTILKTKDDTIGVKFVYTIDYSPEIAKIEFSGSILINIESKLTKEILKQWEDKKMPDDFKIVLFNLILRKSNVKSLQFEDELNLPLHINLPSLKKQEISENKK